MLANAAPLTAQIQHWPIDRLIFYARNPRKNDGAVDRMCGSIREFGFKIPVLARSDGEVIDLMRKGQGVLSIVALGPVVDELEAAIHELRPVETETKTSAPARAVSGGG